MRTKTCHCPLIALTAILALACGDDAGTPGTTVGVADGGATNTTGGGDTGNGTDDGATGQGPGETGVSDTAGTAEAGSGDTLGCANTPQPNGSTCIDDCECESGSCYFISILGGQCGECNEDADCPNGGCTIPNPLEMPPTGAVCNDGGNGQGCETDEVCQDGLSCGTLIDVAGIITLSTCGQCLTDVDCSDGQLCSPTIDVAGFTGELVCVDPGTVPNGQACQFDGTGNQACNSGICATVDIMGIVQVGICGECEVDGDCAEGEVCTEADINIDTSEIVPPMCSPA